jgi:ribosomal protein S18 acetylase RimI-like enzyme
MMSTAFQTLPAAQMVASEEPRPHFIIPLKSKPGKASQSLALYSGEVSDIQTVARVAEAAVMAGDYPHKDAMLNYFRKELSVIKNLESVFSSNGMFYVAKDATGRIVGFIAANPMMDSRLSEHAFWNMNKLYLLPEYQGSGAGSAMMRIAMQEGLDRGFKLLYLQTITDFQNAIALYEKQGFRRLERCLIWDDPICVEMIYTVE